MIYASWYKVEICIPSRSGAKSVGRYVDVTGNIDGGIALEESSDMLDKLTFVLSSTDESNSLRFIDALAEGMKVRAWFGYMDGMQRLNQSEEMFSGYIGRLAPRYPDNARPVLEVVAYDPAWLMTRVSFGSQRTFPLAHKKAMSVKEVIEKVMESYAGDISVGRIELPEEFASFRFKPKSPIVQAENDWKFLKRLAYGDGDPKNPEDYGVFHGFGCIVHVSLADGKAQLNFVDGRSILKEKPVRKIMYPRRGEAIVTKYDPLAKGQLLMSSAQIDDDMDAGEKTVIVVPADAFKDVLTANEIKAMDLAGGALLDMETFFDSFQVDYDRIQKEEKAGTIKWSFGQFVAGKISWKDFRSFVGPRIIFAPAGQTQLPSDIAVTEEDLKNPVARFEFLKKKLGSKEKGRKSAGVKMSINLPIGSTDIRPRTIVEITGLGEKYDSSDKIRWFVDTVTHHVSGKYSLQMTVTM